MISTGGALSPQGPTWAAAKSTLPGFPQRGGHEGGLLDDLPEDKQRGSMVRPQAVGASFLGLSGKEDLGTPQHPGTVGRTAEPRGCVLSLQSSPFPKLVCCRGPALSLDAWQRTH